MPVLQWELGTDHVARVCQVPYRTLDNWLRTNLLPEPMVPAKGHGSARVWGLPDIVRACLVARLRRGGVSVQAIRKALAILAEWDIRDPLAGGMLLAIDGQPFWESDETALVNILARQKAMRPMLLVNLAELVVEVRARVEVCA